MKCGVLVAEDDALARLSIRAALESAGHFVDAVEDGQAAVARFSQKPFDIIISDVRMPKLGGLSLFHHVKKHSPSTAVVLITGHLDVNEAVEALKAGVDDYVTKPFDMADLLTRVHRLGERVRLNQELQDARQALGAPDSGIKLIGKSPAMLALVERVHTVAPTDASVVLFGESGTGKELVARAIHASSSRAAGPFITVNCASFPETLIEAELFGHERGAFTGATQRREGRFKAADGGTLLLDEVGEIPLAVQAKLLRVLQEGTIEPLGSNRTLALDVRLICATHRNLKQMIAAGTFREDLYYRLNVLDIHVPSLRDRRSDLPILVNHFYRRFAGDIGEIRMKPRAWAALMRHSFPGNVRELEHAIQHAVVLSRGKEIDLSHLPSDIVTQPLEANDEGSAMMPLAQAMKDFERQCLIRALESTNGIKFKAARMLGISRKTLWEKLRAHQITEPTAAAAADDKPSIVAP